MPGSFLARELVNILLKFTNWVDFFRTVVLQLTGRRFGQQQETMLRSFLVASLLVALVSGAWDFQVLSKHM